MFRRSLQDSPVLLTAVSLLLFACSSASDDGGGSPGGTDGATGATGGSATGATGGTPTETGGTGGGPSAGTGAASTGGSATGGLVGSGGVSTGGSGVGGQLGSGGAPTGGSGDGGLVGTGGVSTAGGVGGLSTGGSGVGGLVGSGGTSTGGSGDGGFATGGQAASGGDGGGGGSDSGGTASTGGASTGTPSAGCGKAPTLTSGKRSIQTSGSSRSFILSIPDNYDNNDPHRLIFAFHWNGGTSEDIDGGGSSGAVWSYYGLRAQANDSTIFVAPQGNNNGWANPGGQDLAFVDDMVQLIEEDLCVDTTRLFALGFSYGGGMSYAIACARATVFRAVAVYSGAQLSGCDGGKDPIAYLGIHGISDGTCNIAGGRSLRDTFVRNNGCAAQNPPEPAAGSLTHTCTSYEGCDAGYPVEWCAFDGGHTPGMVDGGGDDGAKTWTKEEVWKFFTQF